MSNRLLTVRQLFCLAVVLLPLTSYAEEPAKAPVQKTLSGGPAGLALTVRMQGPYDAEVPLQIVCYFKYSPELEKRMQGAPVELDRHLRGVISSLRSRGDFAGDDGETLLIDVPANTIKSKRLLLIGLGEETSLSSEQMQRVGRMALREAARIGATQVAFAPLIKDQGNNKIPAGDVETAVIQGMLLAYDTEQRLQREGFAKPYVLREWIIEAGPMYYDETIKGVSKAIEVAAKATRSRDAKPYANIKQ